MAVKNTEKSLTIVKNKKGETFRISYDTIQGVYYIYKKEEKSEKKLGKAKTPIELENKFVFR